jgi:hypothetical protein
MTQEEDIKTILDALDKALFLLSGHVSYCKYFLDSKKALGRVLATSRAEAYENAVEIAREYGCGEDYIYTILTYAEIERNKNDK